jgi:hypothetical protein
MKTCTICGTEQDNEMFELKYDGSPGRRRSYCRTCKNNRVRKFRHSCAITWKIWAGGKCIVCGYKKCQAALEFHHRDPSTKESSVSRLTSKVGDPGSLSKTAAKIRVEILKCDLLCANCHREVHVLKNEDILD